MTLQHTPTPWRAGDGNTILATWPDGTEVQIAAMFHTTWSGNDGGKTRRIQDETPGNRALIIRAANNHEALLAALKLAVQYLEHPDVLAVTERMALPGSVPVSRARAAIAKATGG